MIKKEDKKAWDVFKIEQQKLLKKLDDGKINQKTYDDELAQIIKKLKI